MTKRTYLVKFNAGDRMENSYHPTKAAALSAAYARLDMAQRDALQFGEQALADAIGRERHVMASSWAACLKLRGWSRIFTGDRVTIERKVLA